MAEDGALNQNEIEELLKQASAGEGSPSAEPKEENAPTPPEAGALDQSEIEALLAGVTGDSDPPSSTPSGDAPSSQPSPDDAALDQSEIEALLAGAAGGSGSPAESSPQSSSSADDATLDQSDIEALLATASGGDSGGPASQPSAMSAGGGAGTRDATSGQAAATKTAPVVSRNDGDVDPRDVDYLLNQAQQALDSLDRPAQAAPDALPFRLEVFAPAPASADGATLDLLRDVEMDLKIELGRTQMYLEDVLRLRKGSVVPLDRLAGDPVDIYVNGRLIARGEVLVLNENFCIRVVELVTGSKAAG